MTTQLSTNPSPTPAATKTTWDIDTSHAAAAFKVRHLMVAHVRGLLGPVSGSVVLDERNLERSRVAVSIDVRGIDTREPKRDEHLRSADFFDAEQFPAVTFQSTRIEPKAGGEFELTGELTIRGVTRPVTLALEALPPAVTDPWGNVKRGVTARGKLNRKDFGLGWNVALEAGGVLVGDEVQIEIEAELTQRRG